MFRMPIIIKIFGLILISIILMLNINNPILLLLALIYLIIFYIISLLGTKFSLLLLLYPIIHFLISINFDGYNFMELGMVPCIVDILLAFFLYIIGTKIHGGIY